ncbi:UNVERIFIED_CONTAM: hypothetical protein GTU68_066453, partial [Idotea baltica]|nr:hypothetical protein [Idotea baltica]
QKKVLITQSDYIPWKGYFDAIACADVFIVFDDLQYTKRDWRNRNQIKTKDGLHWLSIPVRVKGKYFQKIKDVKIADPNWNSKHWKSIVHHYGKAKYFKYYKEHFEELYANCNSEYLHEVNILFLKSICQILEINTPILFSSDYTILEGKNERIMHLCQQVGATSYISGPTARHYLDQQLFADNGIEISYMNYDDYPIYKQVGVPFMGNVSVLDLLFNVGADFASYMQLETKQAVINS